jgi:cell wall-associated NlpC family hydrolase
MNRKKRNVIFSYIVVSLLLLGIGGFSYVFYSMAVSAAVVPETLYVKAPSKTASSVLEPATSLHAASIKSLYLINVSNKWLRIIGNDQTGYLSAQNIALNKDGLTTKMYPEIIIGTAKLTTPLKTGPDVSYCNVVQIPLGKTLEIKGDVINAQGEKWFMYKFAYATYYVAAKDVEIIAPTPPTAPPIETTSKTPAKTTTPSIDTTPATPATANAQKIISLAYSKLGCAYVYGATGPNSFDCSGFVYWVVNNSGVPGLSVPRTSSSLYTKFAAYNIGTTVANAKPGDIIFFSPDGTVNSGISHSAIYYGDSKMIHASEPKTGVILTTVAYSTRSKSVCAIIRLPGC